MLNAIADAIGVDAFRRAPVTSDVVLMSLTHGRRMHEPLQAHHLIVTGSALGSIRDQPTYVVECCVNSESVAVSSSS